MIKIQCVAQGSAGYNEADVADAEMVIIDGIRSFTVCHKNGGFLVKVPLGEWRVVAPAPVVPPKKREHNHYFKDCPYSQVDVYRMLLMFGVTDPCLQHAAKKILVAGGRGAGKDISRDIKEAIDTLSRWQEMRAEEKDASNT